MTANVVADLADYLTDQTRFWVVRARVLGRVGSVVSKRSSRGPTSPSTPRSEGEPSRVPSMASRSPPWFLRTGPGKFFRLRAEAARERRGRLARSISAGSRSAVSPATSSRPRATPSTSRSSSRRPTTRASARPRVSGMPRASTSTVRADGLEVDTPSLSSLVLGGIAFETPATVSVAERRCPSDMVFELYPNKQATKRPPLEGEVALHRLFRGIGRRAHRRVRRSSFAASPIGEVKRCRSRPRAEDGGDPDSRGDRDRAVSRLGLARRRRRARLSRPKQVERGLRARLATKSLLTGQRAVDFDFLERATATASIRELEALPRAADGRAVGSTRSPSASRASSRRSTACSDRVDRPRTSTRVS